MATGYKFECSFCGTRFKLESRFMDHRCKQMIRDEEIRTPLGQAAWSYYEKWMKANRRAPPSIETFTTSNYYTAFKKFARFAQKVGLPDPDRFIRFMREKDIPPVIWVNDEIYASYIEHVDKNSDPLKEAERTINCLFSKADDFECDVSKIFDHIEPNDLIMLLFRRQISPWILLHSTKFKQFLINRTTDQEKVAMEAIIRPDYWAKKKAKHPEIVSQMKKLVRGLDL